MVTLVGWVFLMSAVPLHTAAFTCIAGAAIRIRGERGLQSQFMMHTGVPRSKKTHPPRTLP